MEREHETGWEDLIDRPHLPFDRDRTQEELEGKRVFVTGAGGSIGSALSRRILGLGPESLVLLDSSEDRLQELESRLSEARNGPRLKTVLGDIGDTAHLRELFQLHRPQLVFHAAAFKQVAFLEHHPVAAFRNNLLGTACLLEEATRHGVERFILLSTDKAVNPTSILGVSKRLAELLVAGRKQGAIQSAIVRFGNVLGTRGSVIPLFAHQIEMGLSVTVTHPEVTRYFLRGSEAVHLLLQATWWGPPGSILVPDLGKPVRITELATKMIRLAGKRPEEEIPIRYIGLRPGEKLHEELLSKEEKNEKEEASRVRGGENRRIWSVRGDTSTRPRVKEWLGELREIVERRDVPRLVTAAKEMIPEYRPSSVVLAPRRTSQAS